MVYILYCFISNYCHQLKMHFSSFSISISAMLSCADALGVLFEANSPLPVLRLPYGAWRAATYDNASDVWLLICDIYLQ